MSAEDKFASELYELLVDSLNEVCTSMQFEDLAPTLVREGYHYTIKLCGQDVWDSVDGSIDSIADAWECITNRVAEIRAAMDSLTSVTHYVQDKLSGPPEPTDGL